MTYSSSYLGGDRYDDSIAPQAISVLLPGHFEGFEPHDLPCTSAMQPRYCDGIPCHKPYLGIAGVQPVHHTLSQALPWHSWRTACLSAGRACLPGASWWWRPTSPGWHAGSPGTSDSPPAAGGTLPPRGTSGRTPSACRVGFRGLPWDGRSGVGCGEARGNLVLPARRMWGGDGVEVGPG